jgi:ABC-type lipoprotein export system ATPase subunit
MLLSALLRGVDEETAYRRAISSLHAVGIGGLAERMAFTLSGGEKQRVAIARAMAARAPVLLADEPTASLDPDMRGKICDSLIAAARAGAIVVVATHDDFVSSRCDRTLVLRDGLLVGARG